MQREKCQETPLMAKQQRSTQLPVDLFRLIDGFQSLHGAKFNTQALAAFLQYFFDKVPGPDRIWMEAAVAVEKGHIGVAEVGAMVARDRRETAEVALKLAEDAARAVKIDPDNHEEFGAFATMQFGELAAARLQEKLWQQLVDQDGDLLDNIIANRRQEARSLGGKDQEAFQAIDDNAEARSLTFNEGNRPKPGKESKGS